jgi:predicted DNA-binding protein
MQRYSISFDDELASWVESRAEERGVSKAKVIRDAVTTARESNTDLVQTGDVLARLEDLEERVDALEQTRQEAVGDELAEAVAEERDLDVSIDQSDQSATNDLDTDDLTDEIRSYLANHPPQSEDGQAALLTAWKRLREVGTAKTGNLREHTYERHSDGYTDAKSLWQSIQRYFDDVPGVEKSGHGEWTFTGDDTAREELRE